MEPESMDQNHHHRSHHGRRHHRRCMDDLLPAAVEAVDHQEERLPRRAL
jgi:hypothetical protein